MDKKAEQKYQEVYKIQTNYPRPSKQINMYKTEKNVSA